MKDLLNKTHTKTDSGSEIVDAEYKEIPKNKK